MIRLRKGIVSVTEQYVYTRARTEHGASNGFTYRTEGIVGAVQKEIQSLANAEHEVRDFGGEYIPVWEKQTLSGRQDKVILQKSLRRRTPEGVVQRASGYVLDVGDPLLARPACWNGLAYPMQRGRAERLTPEEGDLAPLVEVLAYFNMNREQFLRLVKSCFNAKLCGTVTLIAVDYGRRGAVEQGFQLLLWIYRFLPYALRRELNGTTCFESGWNSRYHLGLVPTALLGDTEGRTGYRAFFPNGGTLFDHGQIEYIGGPRRMRFEEQGGLYSQWLSVAIRQAMEAEAAQRVLAGMDSVYRRFDQMISSLPEEDRYSPNYYDALCWNQLRLGENRGSSLPARGDMTYFEDFLAFGSWPEVLDAVSDILDALERLYTTPASPQLIRLVTKILLLDGAERELDRAKELLAAILSKDMESAEIGESSTVSARYLQVMTANGLDRGTALQILSRVFFPETFNAPAKVTENGLWENAGTSRLAEEGLRRCNDWMSSYVNVCLNADELIDCGETVITELNGFPQKLLEQALDCLLGAQETRCYYAKLEILPSHLTACFRCMDQAWENTPEPYRIAAERYYAKLLKLLIREYVSCWAGRSSLRTICELAAAFRRENWQSKHRSELRELVLTHCADIGEYEWERLKTCLSKEDSGILQRLWQVLDLLEDMQADADLENRLARQICRYVLHSVPAYVNDNWLVCEVRDRPELAWEGYYLELLTLRDFLQGTEQTLERLQQYIKKNHVPGELMKDMMKFLYRAFQQEGMAHLDLAAVEGVYIASRGRLKVTQQEVFRTVCRVRGGRALIQLLECWPTAAPSKGLKPRQLKKLEADCRPAAYPWLKTNQSLMEALLRLSQDRETLSRAAAEEETFYLELAEAINALAPAGTVARPYAVRIIGQLLALQEEGAGLKIKMICSSRKRLLLAE